MKTFSGAKPSQRPDELQEFIGVLQRAGCMSYLEIGARHGDSFHAIMSALPKGSFGIAVDLPGGAWGTHTSQSVLQSAVEDLRANGYDAHVVFGDSADTATLDAIHQLVGQRDPDLDWAEVSGPIFDACLIDADHRYDAVMRDFDFYSPLAHLVALHDIDGHGIVQRHTGLPVEVPQAWEEIKARGYRTEEIIGAERGMGIGLVLPGADDADPEDGDEG